MVCFTAWSSGYAQVEVLKGRLRDTALDRDCSNALISLLRSDSSLLYFTRSGIDGRFEFSNLLPTGVYIIMIEHPFFLPLFRRFEVQTSAAYDFGIIPLSPKADSLESVLVTPEGPRAQFRRDTVEYSTGHLTAEANATVEAMIGRLPGLQVSPDGTITYNGQKIQRVLVDGQEMFGSDVTLITRNLNADMIAKVQIVDSKSRQSQFTGIDDGQRTKALNLILKEDSKKGYFVKAEGGGDLQGYYQAGGILGSFKDKQQLMVLGTAANTGSIGFNGASGSLGTGIYIEGGTDDALGASAGTGIP